MTEANQFPPFHYEMGRLAYDPEETVTPKGTALVKMKITVKRAFSSQVDGQWVESIPDEWFDVAVFNEKLRTKAAALRKGNIIVVGGTVKEREYNGKTYKDLTAQILQRAVDIEAEEASSGW